MLNNQDRQSGSFLIEALIGILLFSIGILALVALQGSAVNVQSDAQYRIEANNLVSRLINDISLGVDRSSPTTGTIRTSLANYAYNTTTNGTCSFAGGGGAGLPVAVTTWVNTVRTVTSTSGLPGSTAAMQQVLITTPPPLAPGLPGATVPTPDNTLNQVVITVCWQAPNEAIPRQHTVVAYIH